MKVVLPLVLLLVCGPAAPVWAADWRWPLTGPPSVSRPFVAPAHRYAAGHRGADLPGVPGVEVRAAGDGVVSYAGLVAGRGVVVVVHGELRTTYEPVEARVRVGALVAAGEVLGVLEPGHAGCPVLACLHWGLRRGDDHLDPVRLVVRGPVRLLPLDGPAPVPQATGDEPPRPPGGVPAGARADAAGGASAGASAGAAGGGPGGATAGGDRRVLAPARARAPANAVSRPADLHLAGTAAASLLGAAAVGVTRRRRR